MRIIFIIVCILLQFPLISENNYDEQEQYKFVVTEQIEYSANGKIRSKWMVFYDDNGKQIKWVSTINNRQLVFCGMKYDMDDNLIEYFQEDPFMLYKLYYNKNGKEIKREEYFEKDTENPKYFYEYIYNDNDLLKKEIHYAYRESEYHITYQKAYKYEYKADKLYRVKSEDSENNIDYESYMYDKQGKLTRKDYYSFGSNKYYYYQLFTYDEFDNVIEIEKYSENKLASRTVFKYKKILIE